MQQSSQLAPHGVESIRIVSAYEGGFAQVAHLSWAGPGNPGDASLYIRPFVGTNWTAKASANTAIAPNASADVTAQLLHRKAKFGEPKLSLHHTGQTHAYVGPKTKHRTQPVQGPRLDHPAGGHVATITCFALEGLPPLGRPLSADPPDIEILVPGPGQDTARLSVALYSGTDEDAMRQRYPFLQSTTLLRFDRLGMPTPLLFGLRAAHFPGPPQPTPGVVAVGGWGPGAAADGPIPMVSVWVGPDEVDEPASA
ncbi:hypothetical protein [Streptodolium elevatio]|uniref:Uncharacterized protein n=1 Tax=Streptodolium elevatio TaxID=3157996 RepID=A0ABV3D8R1_9ACTN